MPQQGALRRFTTSVSIGTALAAVPFVRALTAGRLTLLRSARPDRMFSNVFDLQAAALLHGHFHLEPGALTGAVPGAEVWFT